MGLAIKFHAGEKEANYRSIDLVGERGYYSVRGSGGILSILHTYCPGKEMGPENYAVGEKKRGKA